MWYLNKLTGLKWDINEKDKDLIKRLNEDRNYIKVEDEKKSTSKK